MHIRHLGFIVAILSASPTYAQRVELLNFSQEHAGAVLEVGPPVAASSFENANNFADELATDFDALNGAGFSPQGTQVSALAATAIKIPLWMQTGIPTGRLSIGPAVMPGFVPSTHNCTAGPYQARYDIGSAAEARRANLFPLIASVACEHGLPVGLFDALVGQESRYQPFARSNKGAIGLAQLMPGTARAMGVTDPWNPVENLRGGARYFRAQLDEFGRIDLALAAYNAGPGKVRGTRRVPVIRETINYVASITDAWNLISRREVAGIVPASRLASSNPFKGVTVASYVTEAPSSQNLD